MRTLRPSRRDDPHADYYAAMDTKRRGNRASAPQNIHAAPGHSSDQGGGGFSLLKVLAVVALVLYLATA